MRTNQKWILAGLPLVLAGVSQAATVISFTNAGFEQPAAGKLSAGFDSTTDIPGWGNTGTAYGDSGVETSGPHTGSYRAYLRGDDDGAYQIANYQMQTGDQFTLTWWAVAAGGGGNPKQQTVTFLSATGLSDAYATTTQLNSRVDNLGGWTQYTLTYTATAADAGKYIGISFDNSSGLNNTWSGFDDFSLTVNAVPEPASVALGGIALLMGISRRRRI